MHDDPGHVDLEQRTLQTIDNPFGTRLSPMSWVRSVTHVSGMDKWCDGSGGAIWAENAQALILPRKRGRGQAAMRSMSAGSLSRNASGVSRMLQPTVRHEAATGSRSVADAGVHVDQRCQKGPAFTGPDMGPVSTGHSPPPGRPGTGPAPAYRGAAQGPVPDLPNCLIQRRSCVSCTPSSAATIHDRKPARLDALRGLPLELIRKIPALLLLHRTLLTWLESPSWASTQSGQDQGRWLGNPRSPAGTCRA